MMLDKVLAQGVRIAYKVSKSTSCIGSCLLFLVLEKLNEELYAWSQVLVEDFVVEACVTDGEAGELSRVAVRVPATFNSCSNQTMLEKLLIEEASMTAQISDQIANFCPNAGVFMGDQIFQV